MPTKKFNLVTLPREKFDTGEGLYAVFRQIHREKGNDLASWERLSEDGKSIWNTFATDTDFNMSDKYRALFAEEAGVVKP